MLIIIEQLDENQYPKKKIPHCEIEPITLKCVGENVATTLYRLLLDRKYNLLSCVVNLNDDREKKSSILPSIRS